MAASLSHIKRCVRLSAPGPHALVFVTSVGRFTQENAAPAKYMQDVFGVEAARRMIILFTHKEDLGGMPLEDYVAQSGNEALRQLVAGCGGRVCAFNNRAVGAEREQQVSQLLGLVQGLVRENGGGHHSSAVYSNPSILENDRKLRSYMAGHWKRRLRASFSRWLSRCLCCSRS